MISRRRFGLGLGAVTVAVSAVPAQARQGFVWPNGKRAALSLTYDDGLTGQLQIAEPQLEAHGFKATFFLTQVNMEDRVADWQALARNGHEIGDHTVTHPCDLRPFTARSFARKEIRPMEAFEADHFGRDQERLYAYPCGATELGRQGSLNRRQSRYLGVVRRNFAAARIVDGGPNDPRLVSRFRYLLQANAPTYDQDDPKLAFSYAQSAIDRGYWAILIFHDVVEHRQASGETSRATHEAILDWISAQPLWCAPMGQVFDYVRGQAPVTG